MSEDPAPAAAAGVAVIAALRAAGVEQLVVAPGSRSAPLARAAAAAELAGQVRLSVRLDERTAGFLALGAAKASGRPAAVICTSGTAVANLFPAVVEARYGGVPLVVVTADRPPELRGRGASQTIDQVEVFGSFPVAARDLPVPEDPSWSAEPVAALVATAIRTRGPVHLNVPFRPPLVAPLPLVAGAEGSDPTLPEAAGGRATDRVALAAPARGLFVVGDLDPDADDVREQILAEAHRCGWPVVAEASSGLLGRPGVVPGGAAALADEGVRAGVVPDLVVTVGPFGIDRGVLALVRQARRHVAVRLRPRTDPPDPLGTAETVLTAVPRIDLPGPDPDWAGAWTSLPDPRPGAWDVAAVAERVWAASTPHDQLLVASSTAIRALAAVARGPGPRVIANRGANGIDGLVSTAYGAALVHPGRTLALLGDLALLHDTTGLLVPAAERRPDLTLVVADNNGGGIFAGLEQGAPEYADTFERVFATPHDRDLGQVLRAFDVPATICRDVDGLTAALADPALGLRAIVARGLTR